MNQIEFCRIECERQGTDKVDEMHNALRKASLMRRGTPTVSLIMMLARNIEPEINKSGIRKTPVTFADLTFAVSADNCYRLLVQLCLNWNDLTPQEIFQEFERIHPFADGNGRVGQILFNWRNGTLHDPVFAGEYVP